MLFFGGFCASQRVQRRKAELTLAQIPEKQPNGWADWHQIKYTSTDSYGNGHRLNTNRPSIPQGEWGGGRVSQIQKSWEAIKGLDRLAPNLAHICRSIREWINAKQIAPRDINGALRGFRGQTFKSLGKLSNGWTDRHQIWFTSADSSGNGHRLNTIRPSIPQGVLGGGGSPIQKYVEAVKRLDRLAPNLAHVCRFIWEWIYAKQIALRDIRGHLVF